jgi:hypothetical protein
VAQQGGEGVEGVEGVVEVLAREVVVAVMTVGKIRALEVSVLSAPDHSVLSRLRQNCLSSRREVVVVLGVNAERYQARRNYSKLTTERIPIFRMRGRTESPS